MATAALKFVVSESGSERTPPFELTYERYVEIKDAKAACLFGLDLEEKLALVLDNFCEFEVELLKLAEGVLIRPGRDHANSMRERLAIDRRFVNVLTACRLYLDQTDHGISQLLGESSRELTAIKKFKNRLYEDHFGYRLMEALRNYVQHAGLAVHAISYNYLRCSGAKGDQFQYTVIPNADVQTLAEDGDFKKSVLAELRTQGKSVDLRPPLREYISCLVGLHDEIRKMTDSFLANQRKIYEEAATSFHHDKGGVPILFPNLTTLNENSVITEKIALATDFLKYGDSLRAVSVNRDIHLNFASNTERK